MNRRIIQNLSIVFVILVLLILLAVLVSYPGFKRDLQAAHERLSRDSKVLRTDKYTIEYNDDVMIQDFDLTKNKISAPTLIVHAKDDALVGYHHAKNAHKNIKQSELVLFEDGGHAMLTKINEIRGLTRDFVSRNRKLRN